MERVFSVEEIPDPYWAQQSPRASGAPAAQPGGGAEGGMNRCSSEWYFQQFLEEAVLDSPDGALNNPSPMTGTSGGVVGAEVKHPVPPAVAPATSAVVDPVEYNAMLKQKLEKDLAAVAMWRASAAMPPERFTANPSLPNADVPHIGTVNPLGGNVVPVQNKLVGGTSGGSGPHLVQNVDAPVKQAASSSSREQSDDDDMEEDEITGNAQKFKKYTKKHKKKKPKKIKHKPKNYKTT